MITHSAYTATGASDKDGLSSKAGSIKDGHGGEIEMRDTCPLRQVHRRNLYLIQPVQYEFRY
jgi:hypothetical protein